MKLVIGLGNPEERYAGSRHNLGFEVVDKLVHRLQGTGYSWENNEKFKSLIYNLKTETYNLVFAKPQTYMNQSGVAVSALVNFYKVNPEDVIVIHDELDLPLGKIKVRLGGAAAGHHGVESIINALGTDQFIRVRLGIGPFRVSAEKFVLEPFIHSEKANVKHMIKQVLKALDILLNKGLAVAQNQYN